MSMGQLIQSFLLVCVCDWDPSYFNSYQFFKKSHVISLKLVTNQPHEFYYKEIEIIGKSDS